MFTCYFLFKIFVLKSKIGDPDQNGSLRYVPIYWSSWSRIKCLYCALVLKKDNLQIIKKCFFSHFSLFSLWVHRRWHHILRVGIPEPNFLENADSYPYLLNRVRYAPPPRSLAGKSGIRIRIQKKTPIRIRIESLWIWISARRKANRSTSSAPWSSRRTEELSSGRTWPWRWPLWICRRLSPGVCTVLCTVYNVLCTVYYVLCRYCVNLTACSTTTSGCVLKFLDDD